MTGQTMTVRLGGHCCACNWESAYWRKQAEFAAETLRTSELTREVERLRANPLPDGGEWRTEYGHNVKDGEPQWFDPYPCRTCKVQRRVWYGPAEPIENP